MGKESWNLVHVVRLVSYLLHATYTHLREEFGRRDYVW
jgi:hypothetical protein